MIFFDLYIKENELFINNPKFDRKCQITEKAKIKIYKNNVKRFYLQ